RGRGCRIARGKSGLCGVEWALLRPPWRGFRWRPSGCCYPSSEPGSANKGTNDKSFCAEWLASWSFSNRLIRGAESKGTGRAGQVLVHEGQFVGEQQDLGVFFPRGEGFLLGAGGVGEILFGVPRFGFAAGGLGFVGNLERGGPTE